MMTDCADLKDGATVLLGGFGDTGVPVKLVDAIRELGLRDLTIVSNGAGGGDYGLALLIKSGSVGKMICSFPRSSDSKIFEALYAAGVSDWCSVASSIQKSGSPKQLNS